VCVGGQVMLLVIIFSIPGRWSPARAKREEEERELLVDAELERLRLGQPEGVLSLWCPLPSEVVGGTASEDRIGGLSRSLWVTDDVRLAAGQRERIAT